MGKSKDYGIPDDDEHKIADHTLSDCKYQSCKTAVAVRELFMKRLADTSPLGFANACMLTSSEQLATSVGGYLIERVANVNMASLTLKIIQNLVTQMLISHGVTSHHVHLQLCAMECKLGQAPPSVEMCEAEWFDDWICQLPKDHDGEHGGLKKETP